MMTALFCDVTPCSLVDIWSNDLPASSGTLHTQNAFLHKHCPEKPKYKKQDQPLKRRVDPVSDMDPRQTEVNIQHCIGLV
jgi:hypothetical protein